MYMNNQNKKFEILATKIQLESLGIDYDITGRVGKITHKYPRNFYEIEINNVQIYPNKFKTIRVDIPYFFLKEV